MKRIQLEVGDIFEVHLGNRFKRHFQFIGIDGNQLNSDVIRVFETNYKVSDRPDPINIIEGPIDFFAHCFIKVGVRLELWERIGHFDDIGGISPQFRSSKDFGRDEIKISDRWEVWTLGQSRRFVGRLNADLVAAEPGEVFPPSEIVYRMRFGRYEQSLQE